MSAPALRSSGGSISSSSGSYSGATQLPARNTFPPRPSDPARLFTFSTNSPNPITTLPAYPGNTYISLHNNYNNYNIINSNNSSHNNRTSISSNNSSSSNNSTVTGHRSHIQLRSRLADISHISTLSTLPPTPPCGPRSRSCRPHMPYVSTRPGMLKSLTLQTPPSNSHLNDNSSSSSNTNNTNTNTLPIMMSSGLSNRHTPVPLRNFGNTCYLNATIQCILHSPGLLSILAASFTPSRKRPATSALQEFDAPSVANPGQLLLTIKNEAAKRNDEFSDNDQSDAHEFLRTFLYVVHSEINRSQGSNAPYQELKDIENEAEEEAMQRWCEHHLRVDDSIIYDLFGGVLRSKCVCSSCGKVSLTFDPFLDLSLPIPSSSKKNGSIEYLLHSNTEDMEEKLRGGNQLLCTRCKRLRNGTRSIKVTKWPKNLVLQLKRFDNSGRKNSTPVTFPEFFITGGNYPTKYQLYGVVCHNGSENWGHYTSFVYIPESGWFLCNDAYISSTTVAEVMRATTLAYILFYTEV